MKTVKTILFALIFINFLPSVSAQQLPIFTQYRDYYGYVNPASVSLDYFGSDGNSIFASFGVSHRMQWVNSVFPSIYTYTARGEAFFNTGGNVSHLVGGYLMGDEAGATTFHGINGRYAAFIGDPEESFMGLGFTLGVVRHAIKVSPLDAINKNDPLVLIDDNALAPDIGIGAFGVLDMNNGDLKLYGGISAPQIFGFNLELERTGGEPFSYDRVYHLYNLFGLYINTSNNNADRSFLDISFWGKYVPGLQYHADLNLRYQIRAPFWLGFGASYNKNVHLETGFNIPIGNGFMKIGYGYDTSFNVGYGSHTGETHEVNVSVIFDK